MLQRNDLHAYQEKALTYAKEKQRSALFLEMGLGKTVIALTLIDELMDAGLVKSALVIAPKKLLNMTWKPELKKWGHLWLQDMIMLEGGLAVRKQKLKNAKNQGLFGVSVDSIATYKELYNVDWDIVIVDESIKIKSRATRRWRGVKSVTENPLTRVVLMSGIPAPNSEMDLWAQYYILDRGKRLGRTIESYRSRFFIHDYYTGRYKVVGYMKRKLSKLIKDISLALNVEDYLSMPDKIIVDRKVEMPKEIRGQYDKMEKDFIIELSQETLEIVNASALLQKTMQLCNGFIYDELGAERLHDAKLEALQDIIEDDAGENFIVTYKYKEDLRALLEKFPEAKTVSEENIKLWNEGKIKILLLHPQASGYGLNLQAGGSIVVWFSLTWSYSDYEQTNARVYRQGQDKPVRIIRLICSDSVEESIAEALERKRGSNKTIMESLKADMVR